MNTVKRLLLLILPLLTTALCSAAGASKSSKFGARPTPTPFKFAHHHRASLPNHPEFRHQPYEYRLHLKMPPSLMRLYWEQYLICYNADGRPVYGIRCANPRFH